MSTEASASAVEVTEMTRSQSEQIQGVQSVAQVLLHSAVHLDSLVRQFDEVEDQEFYEETRLAA